MLCGMTMSVFVFLPDDWLDDNDVNADVPSLDEELDRIDNDGFLLDGLSTDGEDERIIPTDAFTFWTWSILL